MRIFVTITDRKWFQMIADRKSKRQEDANFWRPGGGTYPASPGELFLFHIKEHSQAFIAGGGFFCRSEKLPIHIAWDVFQCANGVNSENEPVEVIRRKLAGNPSISNRTEIGCNILSEIFIFPKELWFSPLDIPNSPYKSYRVEENKGQKLWNMVTQAIRASHEIMPNPGPASYSLFDVPAFGTPQLIMPRLGQAGFRAIVLDAYSRRCSVTGERTLPVLEAAHIQRYSDSGEHSLANGLLLRSDLHRLFDGGYLGINPKNMQLEVSRRIRSEFENGRDYYALQNRAIRLPQDENDQPNRDKLQFHWTHIFH